MGFGFNLVFIFILLPALAVLLLLWITTWRKIFGKTILYILIGVNTLITCSLILQGLTSNVELDEEDYRGSYIVDRSFFPGVQADWQYNRYRFEIKENDSIFFYCTDGRQILKTYKGIVSTISPSGSARLILNMESPVHHIVSSNPTTYRSAWNFYLTFNSQKFNNVFFRKGEWRPLVGQP